MTQSGHFETPVDAKSPLLHRAAQYYIEAHAESVKGEAMAKELDQRVMRRRDLLLTSLAIVAALALGTGGLLNAAQAEPTTAPQPSGTKPNIVVIFGDDIGQTNVSAYSFGVMGYKTPNIDRIAREGMMFTDYYAEQSCTAGRSSFITGRVGNWKMNFCEQRTEGTLAVWRDPFTCLRAPTMFNLRMDPYERAEITSNTWNDWSLRHSYMVVPTQALVAQFISTFKEFPPRQRPSSFSVDQIMEQLKEPTND